MQAVLFRGVKSKEEQEQRSRTLYGAKPALEILEEIIRSELRTNVSTDYDNPSWAYLQADMNGWNRALNRVLDLLTLEKKEQ